VFCWTSEHSEAFQALKQALISAPVLALPDFSKVFTVETDASDNDKGIGAVLQQDGHPIAYLSKALGPKNQVLSTYEKESLAILMAIEHWRSYLQQGEFIIKTDQKSPTHLDDQRLTTPWQHKALTKLMGLQYKLMYKKGVENLAADALSRVHPQDSLEVLALSVAQPSWLQTIMDCYALYPETIKLLAALALQNPMDNYELKDGIIRYKGKILPPPDQGIQNNVLQALHSGAVGGHSGFQFTYRRIKNVFWWPKMKDTLHSFVASCQICQQAKSERVKYPELLQPLPVPEFAWQVVSMDFIEGLPSTTRLSFFPDGRKPSGLTRKPSGIRIMSVICRQELVVRKDDIP